MNLSKNSLVFLGSARNDVLCTVVRSDFDAATERAPEVAVGVLASFLISDVVKLVFASHDSAQPSWPSNDAYELFEAHCYPTTSTRTPATIRSTPIIPFVDRRSLRKTTAVTVANRGVIEDSGTTRAAGARMNPQVKRYQPTP